MKMISHRNVKLKTETFIALFKAFLFLSSIGSFIIQDKANCSCRMRGGIAEPKLCTLLGEGIFILLSTAL